MAWNTITPESLLTVISGSELTALKSAALDAEQDGDAVVAEAIATATNKVRGYIAGNVANTLGPDGTVPGALKHATLVLVRNAVFTRLPALESLNSDSRREEVRAALAELKDVSRGDIKIEQPETAAAEQNSGGGVEVLTTPTRTASRANLAGLL